MSQVQEFLSALVKNVPVHEIPEDIRQGWIENPRGLQNVLRAALNPPANGSAAEFTVFKTVKLRTGIDAVGYRKAIKGKKVGNKKMNVGDYANDILGKPAFAVVMEETELDLVVVSVAELGFKNGAKLKDIYDRAKEKGLQLCPNQVGPELRLQYEDQPNSEWLVIGMEPITDSAGVLNVFYVVHNVDGRWLYTRYDHPGLIWDGFYRFVFVLPRK